MRDYEVRITFLGVLEHVDMVAYVYWVSPVCLSVSAKVWGCSTWVDVIVILECSA